MRSILLARWGRCCRLVQCVVLPASLAFLLAAAPARAAPAVEVQVTTNKIADIEFDSARDGNYCPTCNFGAGNSRVTFVDRNYQLWVGGVDFYSGDFYPPDGQGVLVDTGAAFVSDFGNGPGWMFSAAGSQLVYTRYQDGKPKKTSTAGIGLATMINGAWSGGFVAGSLGRISPKGTLGTTDPVATISYGAAGKSGKTYWRNADFATPEVLMPFTDPNRGLSLRWVPGTRKIIFPGAAKPDANGVVYQQIFLYDTASGVLEQLTTDPIDKRCPFMFQAPEFDGDTVFFTISGGTRFDLYRQLPDANGVPTWTLFNSVATDPSTPYISGSPEAFVHNQHSWIVYTTTANAGWSTGPSQLALAGIDPANPQILQLTDATSPSRWRSDPEYFITANGPYIFYTRATPGSPGHPTSSEGVWRVDTGLGPAVP